MRRSAADSDSLYHLCKDHFEASFLRTPIMLRRVSRLAITHLEFRTATYEHDGLFALFRYELESSVLEGMVFFKAQDQYKSTVLNKVSVSRFLDLRRKLIECHPLAFVNVILGLLQRRFHQYARWRVILFDMESRLGVSRQRENREKGWTLRRIL